MMTKFSRWMLYNASYVIGYVLVAFSRGVNVYLEKNKGQAFQVLPLFKKLREVIVADAWFYGILSTLIIIGAIWTVYFFHWKCNTRVCSRMEEDSMIESVGFLLSYILAMVCVTIDAFGILVDIGLWLLLGVIFTSNSLVRTGLVFYIFGYKIYKTDKVYVITKMSREKYNLELEDNPDGIEARELVKDVFITFRN